MCVTVIPLSFVVLEYERHSDYLITTNGLTVKLNKKGFGLLN